MTDKDSVQKTVRLNKTHIDMLQYIQNKTGMSFSELVRLGLREEYNKQKELENKYDGVKKC